MKNIRNSIYICIGSKKGLRRDIRNNIEKNIDARERFRIWNKLGVKISLNVKSPITSNISGGKY